MTEIDASIYRNVARVPDMSGAILTYGMMKKMQRDNALMTSSAKPPDAGTGNALVAPKAPADPYADVVAPPQQNADFATIEKQNGLPAGYLNGTYQIESGGGRNTATSSAGAKGPFQFIASTAKTYGLADPQNLTQSAIAAAKFAADNAKVLTPLLQRAPSAGELYIAHQQGANGAAKLLTNPNMPAANLVGLAAIKNNLPKDLQSQAATMTAGQFVNFWGSKFGGNATVTASALPPVNPAVASAPIAVTPVSPDQAAAATWTGLPEEKIVKANAAGVVAQPTTVGPIHTAPAATSAAAAPVDVNNDDALLNAFGGGKAPLAPAAPSVAATAVSPPTAATAHPMAMSDDDLLHNFAGGPSKVAQAAPVNLQRGTFGQPLNSDISINDVGRAFAEGAPIVGGVLNKADAATNAALAPVIDPLLPNSFQKLDGKTYNERYAQALALQNGQDASFEAAHPYVAAGAKVAGGIAATVPLIAAAPAAFGVGEGGIVGRSVASALTGGALSGADTAVRTGGDVNETAKATALGVGLGAVAPSIGHIIGAGANKLLGSIPALTPRAAAAKNLLQGLSAAGEDPADIAVALSNKPHMSAMDVSDTALTRALGIVTQPGEGRNALLNAVKDRVATAPVSVQAAYDSALGKTPDVKQLLDDLQTTARTNAKKGFSDALDNAKPVDVSPVIKAIDEVVNPGIAGAVTNPGSGLPLSPAEHALMRIRSRLTNGTEQLTDANALHQIQSGMREQIDTLSNSASGSDRLMAGELAKVRGKIVDAIDQASGGKFKPAQAQYADDLSVKDSFHKGLEIFDNGKNDLENRPEYWQAWKDQASPDDVKAAIQGVRVAADQKINAVRNAVRSGTSIPDVGFNRDKLAIMIGPAEADKLAGILADQQAIAKANNLLTTGSKTSLAQESVKAVSTEPKGNPLQTASNLMSSATLGGVAGGPPGLLAGMAAGAAMKGGSVGLNALATRFAGARNKIIADAVSQAGGDTLNNLMLGSLKGQARQAALVKSIGRGGNMLTRAAVPSMLLRSPQPADQGGP